MGKHMLGIDWSKSGLGPITSWPRSLVIAVNICLKNEFPISIWWGREFYLIYNDAYRPYLGDKHPAMGKKGLEIWGDIKGSILPMLEGAFQGESSNLNQDLMLVMHRNGFSEEVYFTFSLSPIFDEEMKVVGVINVTFETTKKVLNTRRMDLLREVSGADKTGTTRDVCVSLSKALNTCPADLPFTLMYLFDDEKTLVLQSHTGLKAGEYASPQKFDIEADNCVWPFAAVINSIRSIKVTELDSKVGSLPGGIWPESPDMAVVLPIISNAQEKPIGVFVAGISPRQRYNEDYKSFFDMVVGHIGKALDTVRSYEEQKRRAEELAKIDHAKTQFFTNVSHEFRTPLSLMLGPLADSLADKSDPLNEKQKSRQVLIQRNALRLLKLVNTILDFSRIEAGRAQICFAPTDLTKLTRELCQLFTSVMEQSSLNYIVEIQHVDELIYVDTEMWEKIVMNLISNAYKFTLKGHIRVEFKKVDDHVELSVSDSGVGIPEHELPNMFRRFHRVENSQGRSFEGSGIGLALIQELTKLHGGTIGVQSKLGEGTTFTVQLPLGSEHLPQDKIREERTESDLSLHSHSIVEEATRWGEHSADLEEDSQDSTDNPKNYRVLLADDNVDMRNYIRQILAKAWHVDTANDGQAAYEMACANPPDLVVSDVMMPRVDGFGLIQKLRENPITKSIPVILLSARAGEEAKVEGLGHGKYLRFNIARPEIERHFKGADDYLVKTSFSEKELLARVKNHLELGRLRMHLEREVEKKTKELRQLNTALYEFIDMICHEIRNPLHGITGSWELLSDRLFSLEKAWQSVSKHSTPITHFDQNLATNLLDMKEYLSNLEECTAHQTRVMDEVVLLTKLYSNKFELAQTVCDPAALLTEILQTHTDKLELRNITVELQPVKFGLRVKVDIRCLAHIINALLAYVIDAVPQGSNIVLSQSLTAVDEHTTHLGTRLTSNTLVIDQEAFESLTSLQQHSFSNRSMGTHYSNTGFTIAISDLLVKAMGGSKIQVMHDEAKGAEHGFSFAVSCSSIGEETVRSPEIPVKARVHTKHVLVVEDNYINQVLCQCLLKKQGYTCEVANNGLDALHKYKPDKFDFILMDIAMPELNGIDVTKRIRDLEKQTNVVHPTFIIGLSAYAQPEKIVEAINAGMNDFISKPATFDKIVNIISQWATADTGKKKSKDDMMSQNIPKPKDSKLQKPTAKPILVVDDNIINQTLLKNLLKKQGYESVLASTGPEVLDNFKPNEFELILMDLTLPLISGIEVTKKIRQQEASLNVPQTVIVGLSAHTDEKTIESAKQAGMNDYLTKPASMEKIYLLINKWIDN